MLFDYKNREYPHDTVANTAAVFFAFQESKKRSAVDRTAAQRNMWLPPPAAGGEFRKRNSIVPEKEIIYILDHLKLKEASDGIYHEQVIEETRYGKKR